MILTNDNIAGVLKVSGTLDIETANSLREALLDSLLLQREVTADLTAVDACDASGLQVLLAGQRDAASLGKLLRLHGASQAVLETAAALGFSLEGSAHTNGDQRHAI
jgi:anti-anti-sigma factor